MCICKKLVAVLNNPNMLLELLCQTVQVIKPTDLAAIFLSALFALMTAVGGEKKAFSKPNLDFCKAFVELRGVPSREHRFFPLLKVTV